MARSYIDSGGAATNSGTTDNNSPVVSGTTDATIVASPTFTVAGTNNLVVTSHGLTSGSGVEFTTTVTLPTGLVLATIYYVFSVDANTLTVHTNVAEGVSGANPVTITAASGTGTHTVNNKTINIANTPDLSAIRCAHCRVTTTGTSHVITMAGGLSGLTTGDPVFFDITTGGTMPTNLTAGVVYFVNALSTTTFRVYTTAALAGAGGASDLNVSGAEVRTLLLRHEAQDSIAVALATNTNRTIFWILAVSDAADLVIVDATVTVSGASSWAIGGRVTSAGLVAVMNSGRFGDTAFFNTDISGSINATLRTVTAQAANFDLASWGKNHRFAIIGKPGARRVLTNTGNGTLFAQTAAASTIRVDILNMELQSQGTGAAYTATQTASVTLIDTVLSDAGAVNNVQNVQLAAVRCRFSGGAGVSLTGGTLLLLECHFHDNTDNVILATTSNAHVIVNCIFERATDRNIEVTLTSTTLVSSVVLYGNTVYLAGNSGYEETVRWAPNGYLVLISNIFKDNGNAAGEANIEVLQGTDTVYRTIIDYDNCITVAGAVGGDNVSANFALNASDITTDPLFVDPDASAGSRNFGLQTTSPAKGIAYTFNNSLSISYRDMGAVQRQETASAPATSTIAVGIFGQVVGPGNPTGY